MKINFLFLLIVGFALTSSSWAFGGVPIKKEINVKGNIQSFAKMPYGNQSFRVEQITDFITYQKTELATGKTDRHGNFDVLVPLKNTELLFLIFDKVERTFFAVPGKSYFIEIKAPIESLKKARGTFAKDVKAAKIVNSHPKELNYLIDTLDYACSKFLQENPGGRKNKKQVDAFIIELKLEFSGVESPYFNDYLKYKEAELLMFIYRSKRKEFANLYFDQAKRIGDHVQKMQVFSSFFKGNFKHRILIDDFNPFHSAFNKGDLNLCLNLIYDAPNATREIRELILLYGIYEIHSQKKYSLRSVNGMLDAIIQQTTNVNHRLIAQHIKHKVTRLKEGFPAPNIVIENENEQFELKKINNKYVYLCFFRSWDESFQEELKLLKIIAKKYADELAIVCIGTDDDVKTFTQVKTAHQGDWVFMHYNFQSKILSDYDIEAFRIDRYDIETTAKYYLIDPDGDLVFSPAVSPTQGFHKDFQRIIAQ